MKSLATIPWFLSRMLGALVLCVTAFAPLSAASITLDFASLSTSDNTPTIDGDYTGGGATESVLVEALSGGVALASAFDNAPSGGGGSFQVTLPTGGMVMGGTYDLRITLFDTDGAVGGSAANQTFAGALILDNTQPVLQSIVTTGSNPTKGGSVAFLATFSEAVFNVGSGDFTVSGSANAGTSISVSGSGSTRTITVNTITNNGTIGLARNGININDAAGNALAATTPSPSQTYTIDVDAPTVSSISRLDSNPTASSPLRFSVVFSEPVTGVTASNFSANAAGVTTGVISVTGSGQAYTVSVPFSAGSGTVGLNNLTTTNISDLVDNDLASGVPGSTQSYTVQNSGPSVSSITLVNGNPSTASSLQFLVTFNGNVTGGTTGNFSVAVSGVAASVLSVSGSGATRTVTVNNITGNGTLGLTVGTVPPILDSLINPLTSGTPTGANLSYTIDNVAPTVSSILRADPDPTNASSVDFIVSFSESVTGVTAGTFNKTGSGVTSGAVSVSGSGQIYTVTVPITSGNGTIGLSINTGGIQDLAFNNLGSGTPTGANQSYTINNTAPSVDSVIILDPSPTGATSVRFLVTFNKAVDLVDAADFSPAPSAGVTTNPTVAVTGSGSSYTITVSSVFSASSGTLGLTVLPGGIDDLSGNSLTDGTPTGVSQTYSITQSAPTLSYSYASYSWASFEDHPVGVNAPLWNDVAIAAYGMSIYTYPVNGVTTPYNDLLFSGTSLSPWFPLTSYTTYPDYTTLLTQPAQADTPPHTVRGLTPLFSTYLDNLGSSVFTAIGQTGYIDLAISIPTPIAVAPLTTSSDANDTIGFVDAWVRYFDPLLSFDETAKTITHNGSQIGTWAEVGDPQHIRVTITSGAVSVSTTTVAAIISSADVRLIGRNPSSSLRRLSASVTNPTPRSSNTISGTIRPYLYDDNARVSAVAPVDTNPGTLIVLPGISRTGSVAVDDVDSAFSFTITTPPAQGTLNLDPDTGFYTYTADLTATGGDTFTVHVVDLGPPGGLTWYGQPQIPDTSVSYTIEVADPFDAQAPSIRSNPPFEVDAEGALSYTLTFHDGGVTTPIVDMILIGLNPADFDATHKPDLSWTGSAWVLDWPKVPAPSSAYYDFGILLTVEDNAVAPPRPIRAAFQPVMLKVRDISGGG